MCELQVHGSTAVIQAVMQALSKFPDFRPAEPGNCYHSQILVVNRSFLIRIMRFRT